jgi:hypothetical protein
LLREAGAGPLGYCLPYGLDDFSRLLICWQRVVSVFSGFRAFICFEERAPYQGHHPGFVFVRSNVLVADTDASPRTWPLGHAQLRGDLVNALR